MQWTRNFLGDHFTFCNALSSFETAFYDFSWKINKSREGPGQKKTFESLAKFSTKLRVLVTWSLAKVRDFGQVAWNSGPSHESRDHSRGSVILACLLEKLRTLALQSEFRRGPSQNKWKQNKTKEGKRFRSCFKRSCQMSEAKNVICTLSNGQILILANFRCFKSGKNVNLAGFKEWKFEICPIFEKPTLWLVRIF